MLFSIGLEHEDKLKKVFEANLYTFRKALKLEV